MESNFKINQEGKEILKTVTTDLTARGVATYADCQIVYKYSDGTSHTQPLNTDISLSGHDQIELKNGLQVKMTIIKGSVSNNSQECCDVRWSFKATGEYIDRPQDIENGIVEFYGEGLFEIDAYGDIC